jgi:hypothetical protein
MSIPLSSLEAGPGPGGGGGGGGRASPPAAGSTAGEGVHEDGGSQHFDLEVRTEARTEAEAAELLELGVPDDDAGDGAAAGAAYAAEAGSSPARGTPVMGGGPGTGASVPGSPAVPTAGARGGSPMIIAIDPPAGATPALTLPSAAAGPPVGAPRRGSLPGGSPAAGVVVRPLLSAVAHAHPFPIPSPAQTAGLVTSPFFNRHVAALVLQWVDYDDLLNAALVSKAYAHGTSHTALTCLLAFCFDARVCCRPIVPC